MKYFTLALVIFCLVTAEAARKKNRNKNKQSSVVKKDAAILREVGGAPCDKDVEFELITGFVYFAAENLIDSIADELKLEGCIDKCRKDPECQALNFETGLCVLLNTAAGENRDLLKVSQFPVFTIYAQKVCVEPGLRSCASPWLHETVPQLSVDPAFTSGVHEASSRLECVNLCLETQEFTCRSATYDKDTKTCILSQMDRNMPNKRHVVQYKDSSDYIEMACTVMPERLCEFQTISNKILRTVDAVIKDVISPEECKEYCLAANFTCYTYDFMVNDGETICRLSHHSSATLAHIHDPYLVNTNSTTYELHSCYQISVECRGAEMLAKITTSKLFDGKVYVRNRPNSCVVDVQNTTDFEITLPYNDVDCDVIQDDASSFTSDIVIQHHDMIVTSADVGLALHCRYNLKNTTVSNSLQSGLEVKGAIQAEYFEETIVDSPQVTMIVSDVSGQDIFFAQVGDNLALRFEIPDKRSPYEIFVRELIAMDGQDSSEIVLIDERGCPTDPSIMQSVVQVGNGKILHAPFQAFKFPSSDVVQFRALVTPCVPKCEPVECSTPSFDGGFGNRQSYGRKKREIKENDIMVAQTVRITDKFTFQEAHVQQIDEVVPDLSCSSYMALICVVAIFLVAQVVVLMAWSYLWHKKRADKQVHLPTAADLYFGTVSTKMSHANYFPK